MLFLRIVDEDYRRLCNGEDLEEIAILEWVSKSRCVEIGNTLVYHVFSLRMSSLPTLTY